MGYRALKYVIPLQSSYVFFLEFLRIFLPQGGFIYYTNNIVYFCFLMERYVCVMAALKKTQRNVHLLVKSPYQNFPLFFSVLKFRYSEKALKFCEISTLFLSYIVPVKCMVELLQNFDSFSEYMNFSKTFQPS